MGFLPSAVRADLLVYSIIINIILYFYLRSHSTRENYSARLFRGVMLLIAMITTFEVVSWMTGELDNQRQIPIHYWSNALFLASTALPAGFSIAYLDYKIFNNKEKSLRRLVYYLIPTYINIGMAIYNHFDRGFLFYIADNNQYYRGIGVNISMASTYVMLIAVVIFFLRYKQLIRGRVAQAIIILFFLPVIGSLLQTMAYGTTLGMPSYTLSGLIIFLILEKDEMSKDPLTNLYTRSNMESRLRYKLKSLEPFTVMIIDMNDFKQINDSFGHAEGDCVLVKAAEILTRSTNIEDMICRYGGDEFLMIIECPQDIGEEVIRRVDHQLALLNESNPQYRVEMSYGYQFVKQPGDVELSALLHDIDRKMYDDKARRKAMRSTLTQS